MRRASFVFVALLAGCSGESPVAPDVRYETRDAIIDPPDQTLADDARDDLVDASTPVDVTVFEVADAGLPGSDVASTDAPALDLPLLQDMPATPCTDLAELYASSVREAAVCTAAAECGARVCETLCCVCEVFVAPVGDRLRALDALRARATALGCAAMLPCPAVRCAAPRSGQCSADGRCVTLREPADAGTTP